MAFNLDDYEPVKIRKKRFYGDYPDGRLVVEAVHLDENSAIFLARAYKSLEEQIQSVPIATGYAQEFKGSGGVANRFSWCENAEESAIGRCLDNAGYSTNDKCSREEMIKVAQKEKEIIELRDQLRKVIRDLDDQERLDLLTILKIKDLKEIASFDLDQLKNALEVTK